MALLGCHAHPLPLVSTADTKNHVPGSNLGPSRDDGSRNGSAASTISSISDHSTHAAIRKTGGAITEGPQPDSLKASDIPEHDILDLEQNNQTVTKSPDEQGTPSPSLATLPVSDSTGGSGNSRKRSKTIDDATYDVGTYKCAKLVANQENLALSNENQQLKARLAKAQSNEYDRKLEAEDLKRRLNRKSGKGCWNKFDN